MVKIQTIMQLIDRYNGKKITGWEIDSETGAVIVYAVEAIFIEGNYYSMKDGKKVQFSERDYIKDLRKKVGCAPIEGIGTGIIVYRKTRSDETEVLLQLRTDLEQYGLFGGSIELGENYKNCAIRELLQESALLASEEDLELKDIYAGPRHVTRYPSGDIVFHTVVVYSVEYQKCYKLDREVDKKETKEFRWITVTELRRMLQENQENFFPNNIPILEDIVNKFF